MASISRDLFDLSSQENPFALARVHWLDDEGHWLLLLLHEVHQLVRFCREDPSFREEVEL